MPHSNSKPASWLGLFCVVCVCSSCACLGFLQGAPVFLPEPNPTLTDHIFMELALGLGSLSCWSRFGHIAKKSCQTTAYRGFLVKSVLPALQQQFEEDHTLYMSVMIKSPHTFEADWTCILSICSLFLKSINLSVIAVLLRTGNCIQNDRGTNWIMQKTCLYSMAEVCNLA